MKRTLSILSLAALALAAGPAAPQSRSAEDPQTLTVLQIDPAENEMRVRETGSTRIRTIEFDERTAVSGGVLGGPMPLGALQPGDVIRVPGAIGSVSDRVRAEQIQILSAPRESGATGSGAGRRPSAMDPGSSEPGALGADPNTEPGALADPNAEPGALDTDPSADPGRVGADPGATDQGTRGTGSQTPESDRAPRGRSGAGAVSGTGSAGSGAP
jgi:hypothetical protein